ncbi:MAG: energy-coupling factor ABC transporter permease [Gammaproteobacteria bacterium]|nr:energy-coupling factor ABC transporter permease [Gammaproteobacteria bacterium]NVK88819.1 energy-coupling factor ABC transporter permease [Gammaproteobacteria bacterium]
MLVEWIASDSSWLWVLNCLAFSAVVLCLRLAQWSLLLPVNERQHLLIGSSFALCGFWLMEFSVIEGLSIHPLVITAATLILGFRFAVISASCAAVGYFIVAGHGWPNLGAYLLLNVIVPSAFIALATRWLRAREPSNLFFYTLGVGFIGSALTVPLVAVSSYLTLALAVSIPSAASVQWQPEWILLAMFPEAFINGVIVSSITVFFPHWMKTFDEDYFLSR